MDIQSRILYFGRPSKLLNRFPRNDWLGFHIAASEARLEAPSEVSFLISSRALRISSLYSAFGRGKFEGKRRLKLGEQFSLKK